MASGSGWEMDEINRRLQLLCMFEEDDSEYTESESDTEGTYVFRDILNTYNKHNRRNKNCVGPLTRCINQKCNEASKLQIHLQMGREIEIDENCHFRERMKNHNPFTFASFMLMKKEYAIVHKGNYETVQLYHMTPTNNLTNILLNNFDQRKNLKSRRRYGPGTSFSNDLDYCYDCMKPKFVKGCSSFSLILVDVLIGTTENRSPYKNTKKVSIDTGVSTNGCVFVKARDDEFYPTHIYTYDVYQL